MLHTAAKYLAAFAENPGSDRDTVAVKVAELYGAGQLNETERMAADQILRTMIKSVEQNVRETVSRHLKHCQSLPRDIAVALANDVETVALPMLEFSSVLTDVDLIELVRTGGTAKQKAIASRASVSAAVANAMIQRGQEGPILTLVSNQGADLNERSLHEVLDRFPSSGSIQAAVVRRPELPIQVTTRLIEAISETLQVELVSRHKLTPGLTEALMQQGREGAIVGLLARSQSLAEVEDLSKQLYTKGALSPTLLLRGLCYGQLDFFEHSVARLAQASGEYARSAIHDSRLFPFKQVYRRAGFPADMFGAFREALDLLAPEIAEMNSHGPDKRRRVTSKLTDREDLGAGALEDLLLSLDFRARGAQKKNR